jgi:hypothetical protein
MEPVKRLALSAVQRRSKRPAAPNLHPTAVANGLLLPDADFHSFLTGELRAVRSALRRGFLVGRER